MLSTAAWNAFLKTLEEPPPNTVFVLATTEAQKVPATVIDRCHRFDFHRPTVEQIASVVRRTAEAESIEIPPEAVAALARSATGSFRDALGTLEQLVTYSGTEIVLEDVLAVLGVADAGLLEETVDAVAAGDARRALQALAAYVEQGRDAGVVRLGPRGARARAARRADARRGARRAVAHARGRRRPARAGRARGARRGRAAARAARRGDGGRARRRRPAHPPRAGAREGRQPGGRRIDAGAARADRAAGARPRADRRPARAGSAPPASRRRRIWRAERRRRARSAERAGAAAQSRWRPVEAAPPAATDAPRRRRGRRPARPARRPRRAAPAPPEPPATSSRSARLWPAVVELVRRRATRCSGR